MDRKRKPGDIVGLELIHLSTGAIRHIVGGFFYSFWIQDHDDGAQKSRAAQLRSLVNSSSPFLRAACKSSLRTATSTRTMR